MKTPIVEYEGDQLEIDFSEIDFDLDRPQSSICPKCSGDIIKLAEGCHICGWSENQSKNDDRSVESSISIPCTVKQPNQPERSGVIKQDLGSRFLIYIPDSDSTVTVPKLFVYPDLKKLDKCSSKNIPSSKKCSSKQSPPSKIPPSKTRRQKGQGSGAIFYRTVTRNGKEYQQAYYHWRENGKQRSKYIPKKLLDKVKQAESRKLPVRNILVLLGEKQKCSSKSSDTSSAEVAEKVLNRSDKCSSKNYSPSKNQRKRGQGSGTVHYRTIKKKGKQYQQAYYHYEIWSQGDRMIKSSEYIPKKMETKIIRMNNEKEPVEKILKVLQNRVKRKR